jgi:hypothetical protein
MRGHDEDGVVIDANGAVRVDGPALQLRLRRVAGRFHWIEFSPDFSLLARAQAPGMPALSRAVMRASLPAHPSMPAPGATRARLLMGGELVSRTTVMEVVSVLAQNGWHGELGIHTAERTRHLNIGDAALRAARSSAPSERLGELLVRMDLLTEAQLEQCVSDGDKERRLGELAVERGYLTREQLFSALRAQMQQIFQNALLEDSGYYALMQIPDEEAHAPGFLEYIPLQELLMDSVRIIDEMAVFRRVIPNGELCPVVTTRGMGVSLTPQLRDIMDLATGDNSVLDMARLLHKDEYEITKLAVHLLQIGAVEMRARRTLSTQQALRMITRFNHVLKRIFEAAHRQGRREDLYRILTSWIAETPLSRYFADTLTADGALHAERVIERVAASAEQSPLESLHQSLQELASFTMLSAGSMLPRDAERPLSQMVRRKLTQLRHTGD